jgi:pSer/pThr/pTyr-binding forkhead associated (FHA) protein
MGPRGLVFLLSKSPVTIGRSGKGSTPDIDLAEWDSKMVISRRHAVIEKAKEGLSIKPEKTTNGTFINGVEVPAGESRVLQDGDKIHFGFKGLELVYKIGRS